MAVLAIFTSCEQPQGVFKRERGIPTSVVGNLTVSLLDAAPLKAKIRAYDNPALMGEPAGEAEIQFTATKKMSLPSQQRAIASAALFNRSNQTVGDPVNTETEDEGASSSVIEEGEAAEGSFKLTLYPTGKGTYYYFELVVTDDGQTWTAKPYKKDLVFSLNPGENVEVPAADDVVEFAGEDILNYVLPEYTLEEEIINEGREMHQVPWKVLWYIVPRVEIDGNRYTRMTLSEIMESITKAREFEQMVEEYAHGILDIKMKPYVSKTTVVRFSGGPTSVRFDRSTIPAFDLQEIGNIDSFDTYISSIKYDDTLTGTALRHDGWVGMAYGLYARSQTLLHDSEVPIYLHEFGHQLVSWYGHEIAPGIGGLMPDLHDLYKYHYFNPDGTVGGYGHAPPTWYAAVIGGDIKHFPGTSDVPLNPTEARGVHWSWWRFTPTKPDGYPIELTPPLVNDDPNKIMISGTLSVFSILPIQRAYITVYDGNGNELDETRMLTGFDNPTSEYLSVSPRRAAFGVIVPKSTTDKAFKFKVRIIAKNGYEETFNNVVSDYFGHYKNTDLTGVPINVETKTIKITGSISGITTEDPASVSVYRVRINLFKGTEYLGHRIIYPEQISQGMYTVQTMPLSEPATLTISAAVDLKMGDANGLKSTTNANSCAWRLPAQTITVHNTDVSGVNFSEVVPLITVSGVVRLNTTLPLNQIRLELFNVYHGVHATGNHAEKMWETTFNDPNSALQNTAMPWTVKLPKSNVRHSDFTLVEETSAEVIDYPISVNLYAKSLGSESLIGGFGRVVGSQNINDFDIITDVTPRPLSGTFQVNCAAGAGAKVEHIKIEFWAAPVYNPKEFGLVAERTFDNAGGLQNTPQIWSIESLPNLMYYTAKFVEVTGNKIVYGNGPTEPVTVGISWEDWAAYNVIDAKMPPVKIWTTDEIEDGKFLHIGGHHTASLDGNDYSNNMGGQFVNTVYATTLEGRTLGFNEETGILDVENLANLAWRMKGMDANGWSVNTARFIDGTDIYFFIERDGVFYEPTLNIKSAFSDDSGYDTKMGKHFDIMAFIDVGHADFGWQRTYIEGTIESIYFNTNGFPGRNRGAMVYAYWDKAYTQPAAVCTIDMADRSYRIQKTLEDAGRTMYLTFVAYVIDDVNLQIKTGWFRPANGQFAVTVTTGERTVVNFAGGIYIEENGLYPVE